MGSECSACVEQNKEVKKVKIVDMDSAIFTHPQDYAFFKEEVLTKIVKKCTNTPFQLKKLYRASTSKFSASRFHDQTDNFKDTFLLVRTNRNRIFGAYTCCTWYKDSAYKYENDERGFSFIFCMENLKGEKKQEEKAEKKMKSEKQKKINARYFKLVNKQKSIMNHYQSGPVFGQGHDIYIADSCNKNQSWCNLGKSYECEHPFGSMKANNLLAGQTKFIVDEYEVWAVIS